MSAGCSKGPTTCSPDDEPHSDVPDRQGVPKADISIHYTRSGTPTGRRASRDHALRSRAEKPLWCRRSRRLERSVYKELGNRRFRGDIPVVRSRRRGKLSCLDASAVAIWRRELFHSITRPPQDFHRPVNVHQEPERTPRSDGAHYIEFNLWVKAVEKAKSTEVDAVLPRCPALHANLTAARAHAPNHHLTSPCTSARCGRRTADSSGNPTARCRRRVSDFLPASADEADWVS